MHLFRRLFALSFAVLLCSGGTPASRAQSPGAVAAGARVSQGYAGETARLPGHVPAWASAANDLGSVAATRRLDNLHLVLARSSQVEAAFNQLLLDQQDPASPRYHQWLTPQQNAQRYGVAPSDVAAVTGWRQSQGLSVDDVAGGGLFITFSGPVSVIERAFSTSLHNFSHESATRYAPTSDPAVPVALAGVIRAVAGLAEHVAHVSSHTAAANDGGEARMADGDPRPFYNSGSGGHYVSPADFNTIYDINPTYSAGINGSGNRVANLIDSRIAAADITGFNSVFGMSVAQPSQIVVPGAKDPGISANSEGEAALDVQRILGTAPGATVDLLVFGDLGFNNIYSALQYAIGTLNDPVVNMSFGACNAGNSTPESTTFDNYFKTGTAQGISFFVSSGDNSAAGCDAGSTTIPATQTLSTNLICASSYATCVGGTEFAEGTGAYWAGSNGANRLSATVYIPEGAWNEPTFVSSGKTTFQASGTGGGVTNFPKPSWQTGAGVPSDGLRDVPDLSFTAAYHDGYLICQVDIGNDCSGGTFKYIIFGTSASSPAMAGVASLLDQKLGARQGNLNPLFYRLAATPANNVFHDVTVASSGVSNCSTATPSICNNSAPSATSLSGGLAGYAVNSGYDLATGLGSLDVTNFLTAAAGSTTTSLNTTLALTASANPITTAQTVTFTAVLTPSSTSSAPAGTVQFYSNGGALGSAVTLGAAETAVTPALSFSAGTYAITAVYSGDAAFGASTSPALALVVNPVASFTLTAASSTLALTAGATSGNTDAIAAGSVNGFSGAVGLACAMSTVSGTAAGTCSLAPASTTLASGGTAGSVLTVLTTAGTSGTLNVLITGTAGTSTSSAVIVVTVGSAAPPSFTLGGTPGSLSFASGATVGNLEGVTLTSVNGFTGTVALSCSVSAGTAVNEPACTISPASVVLTSGGTAASVATISTVGASANAATGTAARVLVSRGASRGASRSPGALGLPGSAVFAALFCLLPMRRRRSLQALMAGLVLFTGLAALSGCGSGGSLTSATATGSAGNYTVTVTGTGISAGSLAPWTTTTTFAVTIR